MDKNDLTTILHQKATSRLSIHESRTGEYQVVIPFYHEDGDMIEVFIKPKSGSKNQARIFDYGMSLQRLSYTYDINTTSRKRVLESILWNNDINNDNGNLYIDTTIDGLYENILKFIGGVQKICNMKYWSKSSDKVVLHQFNNTAYSVLNSYNKFEMRYRPPGYDGRFLVDWFLSHDDSSFYIFGIGGYSKASNTTIAILEYLNISLVFNSVVVYYNPDAKIPFKTKDSLNKHANKIYHNTDDFRNSVQYDIAMMA